MEIAGTLRNSFRASVVRTAREVEHRIGEGPSLAAELNRTPNARAGYTAVRRRLIKAVVERGTARTAGQGPKCAPSGKGGADAQTARRLAQRQQCLQGVRNSSLVEYPRADNSTGLSAQPKPRDRPHEGRSVGEHAAYGRSGGASRRGRSGREDAGMSNVKEGWDPPPPEA